MSGEARPVFIVHSLAHAEAAARAAAGAAIVLSSAPGAAGYAGAGWFLGLLEALAEAHPAAEFTGLLDCGDDAALAVEALHAGAGWVRCTASGPALADVADIAGALGARLNGDAGPALDLGGADDAEGACRRFLAGAGGRGRA